MGGLRVSERDWLYADMDSERIEIDGREYGDWIEHPEDSLEYIRQRDLDEDEDY